MKKRHLPLVLAVATSVVAIQAPALAQDAVVPASVAVNSGGKERIQISGKLRMLSQRIPSAVCHYVENLDKDAAAKLMVAAVAEFDTILDAIENGDASMNITGEERDRKVLVALANVRETWAPIKAAADAVAGGDTSAANVQTVLQSNMDLLDSTKLLVAEVVGEYSNPAEMVQAESMLIDISGRQRMLTQKMSKEACILRSDFATEGTAESLKGTMALFETSLDALQNGMPEVGLRKPPTPAIAAGLGAVRENWKSVKPKLEAILAGGDLMEDAKAAKFGLLNKTMAHMNKVVIMYQDAVTRAL